MIINLNPKHGFEVWINQKLSDEIEMEFKRVLETEELFYYYIPCHCDTNRKDKNEVKWAGKVKLIDFIKKIQSLDSHFCPIGVTNSPSKKQLLNFFENGIHQKHDDITYWDYWIGDVVQQDMVCGDDLVIELWNRIKNKETKDSKTRKNYF